jgi:hypothetical protein
LSLLIDLHRRRSSLCEGCRNEQGGSESSENHLHGLTPDVAAEKVQRCRFNASRITGVDAVLVTKRNGGNKCVREA